MDAALLPGAASSTPRRQPATGVPRTSTRRDWCRCCCYGSRILRQSMATPNPTSDETCSTGAVAEAARPETADAPVAIEAGGAQSPRDGSQTIASDMRTRLRSTWRRFRKYLGDTPLRRRRLATPDSRAKRDGVEPRALLDPHRFRRRCEHVLAATTRPPATTAMAKARAWPIAAWCRRFTSLNSLRRGEFGARYPTIRRIVATCRRCGVRSRPRPREAGAAVGNGRQRLRWCRTCPRTDHARRSCLRTGGSSGPGRRANRPCAALLPVRSCRP